MRRFVFAVALLVPSLVAVTYGDQADTTYEWSVASGFGRTYGGHRYMPGITGWPPSHGVRDTRTASFMCAST